MARGPDLDHQLSRQCNETQNRFTGSTSFDQFKWKTRRFLARYSAVFRVLSLNIKVRGTPDLEAIHDTRNETKIGTEVTQ
ncbi:uncharacterized protein TrAtP1_005225 [Trichoderma atroviride]|uniref:uncharacterized protein n=1 Tax=Hypocrea atroviridis TaxID=63577 RepID=UPI00332DE2E4|nr:hypothetical protein TrAtP1_005225 [Trichoderma atroviride]